MGIPILIVNSDSAARKNLRQPLESAGYPTLEADNVEDGLALLRTSESAMVTLFKVALFNNVISGTDGIAFLGAARYDAPWPKARLRGGHTNARSAQCGAWATAGSFVHSCSCRAFQRG